MKRLSAQDDNNTATTNANITSGSVTGITDLAIADGGTAASTAAGARTNLGLDAGGAGDIWVEKAGDTMSGNLTFSGAQKIIGGTGTTDDLTLQTTSGVGATGADMHFLVGNNGATEAMTILNSGNVGIGITNPTKLLEVTDGTRGLKFDAATSVLSLTGVASSLTQNPRMQYMFSGDADAGIGYLSYAHDNLAISFDAWFNGANWISSHAGSNFAVYKNGNNLLIGFNAGTAKGSAFGGFTVTGLVCNSTGQVGVGGSPTAKLEVYDTVQQTAFTGTTKGTLHLRSTTATGDYSALTYGSSAAAPGAKIAYKQTAAGGFLQFGTTNTYGSGITNTAMTIDQVGNVGIGTTGPNEQLEITGNFRLPTTTSTTGQIKVGATRFLHSYGTRNLFLGENAGNFTLTGTDNTGIGQNALLALTSGVQNMALGGVALDALTSGTNNVAMGYSALGNTDIGGTNVSVGTFSLLSNTSGSGNTAIGYVAGYTLTGGNANVSGNYNTHIGYGAGPGTTTQLSKSVAIGYNALVTASNAMVLGGTGADAVNVGIGTTGPQTKLQVSGVDSTTSGIVASLVGTGAAGAYLHFTDNTLWNWAMGEKPTTPDFEIVSGRSIGAAGTTRLTIQQSSGYVGIGIVPLQLLTAGTTTANSFHIGTSDPATGSWIRNDGTNMVISNKNGPIYYGYSGNAALIHRFGSTGLGVTFSNVAPAASLEVTSAGVVRSSTGGALGVGAQPLASNLYVQSRLQNLITNGNGLLQNNYNFSSFTFDATELHGGGGSFLRNVASSAYFNDELLPVDPEKYYRLAGWGKSGDTGGANYNAANKQYLGVAPFDIDGLQISPNDYAKYPGSTDTTLVNQLNPGDTTMTLTDATGWNNAGSGYQRSISWWPYTNSKGYTYPNYTYTKNGAYPYADYTTNGVWAAGGIAGNVITIRGVGGWQGPVLPAGTPIRNQTSGGTYKYITASNVSVPNAWTRYEGYIGSLDTGGTQDQNQFPYGTAYIKLLFLVNYHGAADNKIRWSDLWFSEMSSRNLEVATATVPGVVSTTTQAFAGDKSIKGSVATSASAALSVTNSATASMLFVRNDGLVGIGTATPGDKLHIAVSGGVGFQMHDSNVTTGGSIRLTQVGQLLSLNTYNAAGTFTGTRLVLDGTNGNVGISVTGPTARLHLPAGTATASSAPLKLTTGTVNTTAEAGAMEFTTDDLFFTITTGAARKRLLMTDVVGGLTSGRVPFATTNGRLTDDADMTFATDTLTVTKIAATTFTGDITLSTKNLITDTTTGTIIGTATAQKVGFHNATPVIQRASAAQVAAATTAATNTTPYGYTTAAQADAIVTLVNEIRAALVEKGIIKGAA